MGQRRSSRGGKDKPEMDPQSAARSAASRLREIILDRPEGAYLGSQRELLELLGVGAVTLHQVARLLEHESLLDVRRGVNGGYYGRRPTVNFVERAVTIYLRAKGTDYVDNVGISSALSGELLRLAMRCTEQTAWDRLARLRDTVGSMDMPLIGDAVVGLDREFYQTLFEMARNPLAELMVRVNFRIFSSAGVPIVRDDASKAEYRRFRFRMIEAVFDKDVEIASLLSRRFADFLRDQFNAASASQLGHLQPEPIAESWLPPEDI